MKMCTSDVTLVTLGTGIGLDKFSKLPSRSLLEVYDQYTQSINDVLKNIRINNLPLIRYLRFGRHEVPGYRHLGEIRELTIQTAKNIYHIHKYNWFNPFRW